MKKKLMAVLLALTMVITLLPTAFAAGNLPFTDVADDFWAEDEISWAYEEGLMNGNNETTFNPGGKVTRQQVWMAATHLRIWQPPRAGLYPPACPTAPTPALPSPVSSWLH